jgi:pantoate--beta-alanine ligase
MIIFKSAADIRKYVGKQRDHNRKTGFVPTMGALHKGHLSLVEQCLQENDITICSIFVNPSQFNNKEDFRLYPVTIEKDIEMLTMAGCDVLFLPSEREIYPAGYQAKHYDLGQLEHVLEGKYRPGHFQGVCQVVDQLLTIVDPDKMYLGRKDYQQCMVIDKLTTIRGQDRPEIVIGNTVREETGLAMSSRNTRLSEKEKNDALQISRTLNYIKENYSNTPSDALISESVKQLEQAGFNVDYVEIANAVTLEPVVSRSEKAVALIAATIGSVRLIDNMQLN